MAAFLGRTTHTQQPTTTYFDENSLNTVHITATQFSVESSNELTADLRVGEQSAPEVNYYVSVDLETVSNIGLRVLYHLRLGQNPTKTQLLRMLQP